jgi:hypothetical protein
VRPDAFVAVAAYGDMAPGYVCTERSYGEGGYEPSAAAAAPEGEAVLKAALRNLMAEN